MMDHDLCPFFFCCAGFRLLELEVCAHQRDSPLHCLSGRYGSHQPLGRLSVVLVEIAYVTLTAGIYAGMQQQAP